jgi:hypothetical protein
MFAGKTVSTRGAIFQARFRLSGRRGFYRRGLFDERV